MSRVGKDRALGAAGRRLAAASLLAFLLGAAAAAPGASAAKAPKPPNIVLIMTDDQPTHTVTPEVMPNLFERVIEPGTSFSDFIVTTPLCCPSRATLLTGQYGHNNGVLRNDYAGLIAKGNVLPRWLQRAGYKTARLGKFLNGYETFAERPLDVAPGWSLWFSQLHKRRFYNWRASVNGKLARFGFDDRDHATEVTNRFAARWTTRLARHPKPFYLQLDYFAPHTGQGREPSCPGAPAPSPQDEGAFATAPLPQPPSFNPDDEAIASKPSFIRALPAMDEATIQRTTTRYRCTLESLLGVDRGIGMVYDRLAEARQLRRTIFVFTSDNGFFFGEHRIAKGKKFAYEENLKVPLAIRLPPRYSSTAVGQRLSTPAANLDLAPTILDLAGGVPCTRGGRCRVMDGRSLRPLLDGSSPFPADRGFLVELEDCTYRGLREAGQIYLEHGSEPFRSSETGACRPDEIEHYDLRGDPHQLDNLSRAQRRSAAAQFQRRAQRRIANLTSCAGVRGRDPAPSSGEYCE